MPQLRPRLTLPHPRDDYDRQVQEALQSLHLLLADLLNKGLRFSDNFNAQEIEYTTSGTPDTEETVAHALKRVPVGFLLLQSDKAVSLYAGGTAWTATAIYVKASVASAAVKILVF